jgi:hypothetical protein
MAGKPNLCTRLFEIVRFLTLIFVLSAAHPEPLLGTEVVIPALKVKPGQSITIPIQVDSVNNLAGIKLIIKYDKNLLNYKRSYKTERMTSLMHIVNDKNPGVLILVMAGPKGIKGEDFSIIDLTFDVASALKGNHTTQLEIVESQLMSDRLDDIRHTVRIHPTVISDIP